MNDGKENLTNRYGDRVAVEDREMDLDQIVEALQTAETKRRLYGRGEKDREIIQAVAAVLQKEERRFMKLLAEVPQDLLRYVEVMQRVGALTKNASRR